MDVLRLTTKEREVIPMPKEQKPLPPSLKAPSAFEVRLEAVFMTLEDEQDPRGAKAWLARLCQVNPSTVSRWLKHPPGPVLALLGELEFRASVKSLFTSWEYSALLS